MQGKKIVQCSSLPSTLVSPRPWSPLPTTSLSAVSGVCGQLQSEKTKWKIMKVDNSCIVHFSAKCDGILCIFFSPVRGVSHRFAQHIMCIGHLVVSGLSDHLWRCHSAHVQVNLMLLDSGPNASEGWCCQFRCATENH